MSENGAPLSPQTAVARQLGAAPAAHTVHFYQDELALAAVVGDFCAHGIACGQPLIVIATASHIDLFTRELSGRGVDVAGAQQTRVMWLDAEATLSQKLGQTPSWRRYSSTFDT